MSGVRIVCMTPVKNEGWILDTFLKCASRWADHILVADQRSTDDSREIVARHPKAILVDNPSPVFNEPERQKLLIEHARAIPAERRILVALDADEILAGDFQAFRDTVSTTTAGTTLAFPWLNVRDDGRRLWRKSDAREPFGWVDDGSPHVGSKIHSRRVPGTDASPRLELDAFPVLHLQYIDWARMRSKHRWYECYERLQFPEKSAVQIYRFYHHMDSRSAGELQDVPEDLLRSYRSQGIDPFVHTKESDYRWDNEVADLLREHGPERFRNLDIWDKDWSAVFTARGIRGPFVPPRRSVLERALGSWLRRTQYHYPNLVLKAIDRLARPLYR